MAASLRICLLIIAIFFSFCQAETSKLACRTCNTKEECQKNGTLLPSKQCINDRHVCVKIRDENEDVISRGCDYKYTCDTFIYCDSCKDEDNCNSSAGLMPPYAVIGIISVVLAKYYL